MKRVASNIYIVCVWWKERREQHSCQCLLSLASHWLYQHLPHAFCYWFLYRQWSCCCTHAVVLCSVALGLADVCATNYLRIHCTKSNVIRSSSRLQWSQGSGTCDRESTHAKVFVHRLYFPACPSSPAQQLSQPSWLRLLDSPCHNNNNSWVERTLQQDAIPIASKCQAMSYGEGRTDCYTPERCFWAISLRFVKWRALKCCHKKDCAFIVFQ